MNRATRGGTLRLGSTRSYTCSMNSEPDSISRLMNPVSTPIATKALRQADKAAAMGDLATPFADKSLNVEIPGSDEKGRAASFLGASTAYGYSIDPLFIIAARACHFRAAQRKLCRISPFHPGLRERNSDFQPRIGGAPASGAPFTSLAPRFAIGGNTIRRRFVTE